MIGEKNTYNEPKNEISNENFFSKMRKIIIELIIENKGTTRNIPFSPKIPMKRARNMGKMGGTSPG